jgi:hypothetical protein
MDGTKAVTAAVRLLESAVARAADASTAAVAVSMADLRLSKLTRRRKAWKSPLVKEFTPVVRVETSLEMVLMSKMREHFATDAPVATGARRRAMIVLINTFSNWDTGRAIY